MVFKIESRLGIAAPVDVVYEAVADLEAWPSWSPIHKSVTGKLKFGALIEMDEYYEGLGRWQVAGTLVDWTPNSLIHIAVPKPFWAGSLMRYIEWEALSDTGTTFSVGAHFDGFFSEREGKRLAKPIKRGFDAMTQALKARVEAKV